MSIARGWSYLVLGTALVAACGGENQRGTAGGDTAAGDVAALNYEVTPDRYRRWVAAQQALDAIPEMPAPPAIDPMRLDETQVRRAVEYLEGNAQARAALARAGVSARDYVLTTVALDQALVTASARPAPSQGAADATRPPAASSRPATQAPGSQRVSAGTPTAPSRALSGTPPRNVELVRRNRDDVVRVLRTMRFRISRPTTHDIVDTTITRTDSVTVGKDLTVKWDVTVRRNRDSSRAKKPASADSTPPDSSDQG
jgi:hypothetical protein